MRIHISFYILLLFFANSSCKKFLSEKSNKALVEIRTVRDLQAILDDDFIMNTKTPGAGQTSDDDYFITPASYLAIGDLSASAYVWDMLPYRFPNDWASAYHVIYNANYCLDKLGLLTMQEVNSLEGKNVQGSAHFFRGYYFLQLAWVYALGYDPSSATTDKGIALRLQSDFNIPSVRASVQATYDQIISDFYTASIFLPHLPQHSMRPSKAAAYAGLARTYLSMHRYDSAFKYANLSLSLQNTLLDYNSSQVLVNADNPFSRFNSETIFYTTQSGNYTSKYPQYAHVDSFLYNQYASEDLRKKAFFFPNGIYYSFKGSFASNRNSFFSGITTSEMLLTRAEAAVRTGDITRGLSDINLLLSNRWVTGTHTPVTITDPPSLLALILMERRKELIMRGLRWADIKRLNKEGANIRLVRKVDQLYFELLPDSRKFAFPLPEDIIETSGMEQN